MGPITYQICYRSYRFTKAWDKKPLGMQIRLVNDNENILAYTTNVRYYTRIMFASLIKPLHNFTFLSGGIPFVERSARARLIRSPHSDYYNKAYPRGKSFNE